MRLIDEIVNFLFLLYHKYAWEDKNVNHVPDKESTSNENGYQTHALTTSARDI